MTPPKCFFKRPDEFYSNGGNTLHPLKIECFSLPNSPAHSSINGELSPHNMTKTEPIIYNSYTDFSPLSGSLQNTPLDLSCKCVDNESKDILSKLSNFLLQHRDQLSKIQQSISQNNYLNLEQLFLQLPQQLQPSMVQPMVIPNVIVTPSYQTNSPWDVQPQLTNISHLSPEPIRNSPYNIGDQIRDNSSSETSSQYTTSQQRNTRTNKRKLDGKLLRPFKLYKGNDCKGLLESLGISEEDELWLKSVVEYKSVDDDVFLFLTNCMTDSTKPAHLTDDVIEKIRTKFGHIFQNCNSTISNPRMVRHPDMTPKELKTDEYWEKRRKNNEAAKRSREARRHKEDDLNSHCEKLQMENDGIRKEIERVKYRIEEIKRNVS